MRLSYAFLFLQYTEELCITVLRYNSTHCFVLSIA